MEPINFLMAPKSDPKSDANQQLMDFIDFQIKIPFESDRRSQDSPQHFPSNIPICFQIEQFHFSNLLIKQTINLLY